jgi:hypothetical protein
MAVLDARPQNVDCSIYAGDTFTLAVIAPAELVEGMTWLAQVRAAPDATQVDATWTVTPPTTPGGPAYITLPSATTTLLAQSAPLVRSSRAASAPSVQRYQGVWDCQVSAAGQDPVKTLVKGTLTIDLDVSRSSG